jgi:peptide/nickel transport system permease protein
VASVLVILGMCVPEFVVGIALIAIFAMTLHWFPPLALIDRAHSFGSFVRMLFLPAVTLTIAMTAYAVRMMRENLIEVLDSGYVQMARLKGLPRWRVLLWHALPSALGPAINVTALNIAWLMGGIVVVETVFNFPGLGRLLIDAIDLKDIPVILGVSLLLTAVYILCNLLADIAVLLLNPKLRHAG